jgi:hypothetical protein
MFFYVQPNNISSQLLLNEVSLAPTYKPGQVMQATTHIGTHKDDIIWPFDTRRRNQSLNKEEKNLCLLQRLRIKL